MSALVIPPDLLPGDGRFGSGPAKIRPESLDALVATGATLLGTSHRQAPVRRLVAEVKVALARLFDLPDGYEVVLGNGGSTLFWDVAVCSLIRHRSAHASFGEFSAKFAAAVAAAPHLAAPSVVTAAPGPSPCRRRCGTPTSTPGRTTRPRPVPSPRSGGCRARPTTR